MLVAIATFLIIVSVVELYGDLRYLYLYYRNK